MQLWPDVLRICCLQPLYKQFLGYEVFGLGFMTSVVRHNAQRQNTTVSNSSGSDGRSSAGNQHACGLCCSSQLGTWLQGRGPAVLTQPSPNALSGESICDSSTAKRQCRRQLEHGSKGFVMLFANGTVSASASACPPLVVAPPCLCCAQLFITMTGMFFSSWLGSWTLSLGEWIIKRLPLVKHIYSASKQVWRVGWASHVQGCQAPAAV